MHISEFSAENVMRCEAPTGFNHSLNSWSASDWITAFIGEFGEAANIVKKLNRVRDGITGNKESLEELQAKLKQEIADAFIYLDLFARSQGVDTEEAIVDTFNAKSREIGYERQI